MRVALVHGYFLHDSGSGIYTRELARALVRLGHEVTLVCQEREPARADFIDEAWVLDDTNEGLTRIYSAARRHQGSCRLVRPNTAGELLVYVEGEFPPFERSHVRSYQTAPTETIEAYLARNVRALETIFAEWPPDIVLAQHMIMQPWIVRRALGGRAPYTITEHGSELNFSVRCRDWLVPFAVEGLEGASLVAAVSEAACADLVSWAQQHDLSIAEKTLAIPPGISDAIFAPAVNRAGAIAELRLRVPLPPELTLAENDDVIAYVGALRPTKGVQHALGALGVVAAIRGGRVRLLLAGGGPARDALERLLSALKRGDLELAGEVVRSEPMLASPAEWGDAIAESSSLAGADVEVAFLGHLEHQQVAAMLAVADVTVTPSVFPEAAALVNVEALAAGALPLAACHSGMADLDDYLAESLGDPGFASLVASKEFTQRLGERVVQVLAGYPTREPAFRQSLHALAMRRYPSWERTVARYLAAASDAR